MKRLSLMVSSLIVSLVVSGDGRVLAKPSVRSIRDYHVTYSVKIPASVDFEESLRVWIPLARSTRGQALTSRIISPSKEISYEINKDPVYGNEMVHLSLTEPLEEDLIIDISYQVQANADNASANVDEQNEDLLETYLKPSRLMVIDDRVKRISEKVARRHADQTDRARAIYDYVIQNMKYDKETPGWGRGDTARACDIGAGNCTDFHSLFVSVARASDVPARFQIGLQLPEEEEGIVPGYHCWAQFYDLKSGWLTVDASEAWKHPEKREFYFGGFDVNKFMISMGRDVPVVPEPENGPLNIFFYPYAEMDGAIFGAIGTEFNYSEVSKSTEEEVV